MMSTMVSNVLPAATVGGDVVADAIMTGWSSISKTWKSRKLGEMGKVGENV